MSEAKGSWDEYTKHFGRHSGIPECCIDFFISGDYLKPEHLHCVTNKWHYQPCPSCLACNQPINIHYCTKACNVFLQSIGTEIYKIKPKEAPDR